MFSPFVVNLIEIYRVYWTT